MPKTAKFQYKCRQCGEVFGDACTSEKNAQMVLICTVIGTDMPKELIGLQPRMVGLHHSCSAGGGVADLQGYILED